MTNETVLLNYLKITNVFYCDDCLSSILKIKPRQQANRISNELCNKKIINRENMKCYECEKKKLANKIAHLNKDDSIPIIGAFYLNEEMKKMTNVSPQGGIRISRSQKFHPEGHIVICAKLSSQTIYSDHFDEEGLLHYTGEGQKGDQTLTKGNKAIYESNQTGKLIFLFKKHNEGGNWEFMGPVKFQDYYTSQQPDIDGNNRLVYIFRLLLQIYILEKLSIPEIYREVNNIQVTESEDELDYLIEAENEKIKKSKVKTHIRTERKLSTKEH
ncbi:MAG: hypothetical protein ACXADY_09875 [Candidatus Hodarchaeales archaeon]|jgi:hypothetical protein